MYGASQVALVVKNPPANVGDVRDSGSIPGSGRSSGEGHGNTLQYSCLENPMDRVRHKRLSPHAVGCSAQGTLSVNVIHVRVHTHTQLRPYLSSKQNTLSSDLCQHFHILCHILCASMTLCVHCQCRLPRPWVHQRHGKA